jgi:hypothetical protein
MSATGDAPESASPSPIERAGRLAGYFAAHAIWCVAEGDVLVPLVASERGEERKMLRFAGGDAQVDVAQAKRWLQSNPERAERAVSIFDGFVTLASGRTDALIVDAVAFDLGGAAVQIIVPYRPPAEGRPFAVHRPKFAIHRTFDGDARAFATGFQAGIDAHQQGKPVWDAARDESI